MKNYIENHAVVLIGNIASSVNVKVKNKERIEFKLAVSNDKYTSWFKVITFESKLIEQIKQSSDEYSKGSLVKVSGKLQASIYKEKPFLTLIADKMQTKASS